MSITVDDFDEMFDPQRRILETMMDFESLVTAGSGAILYPHQPGGGDLRQNLHAAAVATHLNLSSLDYAKRTYASVIPDDVKREKGSKGLYHDAFLSATAHIRSTEDQFQVEKESRVEMGVFAASIALQRLDSGFKSAHLLYQLGLNYEGDAVARYVLEQIAWSLCASQQSSLEEVGKLEPQKLIGRLKPLLPWAGQLYGDLSKVGHAGLAKLQRAFMIGADSKGRVLLTWSRLSISAAQIMLLADAWAVVWEHTQAEYMKTFQSLHSRTELAPRANREFLATIKPMVDAIFEAERQEQDDAGEA